MVRLTVLIPATEEEAMASRPRANGSISLPMVAMIQEATKLGISDLRDVKEVMSALGGMSWSLRALTLLAKKATIDDIKQCIELYDTAAFKLPEEKCVRMIKSILARAKLWQEKATRALRPIPGETTPYDRAYLEKLLTETKDIPFTMSEEARLQSTIEDKGARHCLCGGPSDGSFMISCDTCDKWYHADCVKFDPSNADDSTWACPPCKAKVAAAAAIALATTGNPASAAGGSGTAPPMDAATTGSAVDKKPERTKETTKRLVDVWSVENEISPHAPNPDTLWPPFGLLASKQALKALGVDDVSEVPVLKTEVVQGIVQGNAYLEATARTISTSSPEAVSATAASADDSTAQSVSASTQPPAPLAGPDAVASTVAVPMSMPVQLAGNMVVSTMSVPLAAEVPLAALPQRPEVSATTAVQAAPDSSVAAPAVPQVSVARNAPASTKENTQANDPLPVAPPAPTTASVQAAARPEADPMAADRTTQLGSAAAAPNRADNKQSVSTSGTNSDEIMTPSMSAPRPVASPRQQSSVTAEPAASPPEGTVVLDDFDKALFGNGSSAVEEEGDVDTRGPSEEPSNVDSMMADVETPKVEANALNAPAPQSTQPTSTTDTEEQSEASAVPEAMDVCDEPTTASKSSNAVPPPSLAAGAPSEVADAPVAPTPQQAVLETAAPSQSEAQGESQPEISHAGTAVMDVERPESESYGEDSKALPSVTLI